MEAKKGDILFYSEIGPVANIIKKRTTGPFNHVEIVIADNVALEIRPRNIGLIDLTFKEQDLKLGEYILVKRPKWNNMENGIYRALQILRDTQGYSLGNIEAWWSGIERLRRIKDNRFESDEWVICSEVVGDSLLAGGMKCKVDYDTSLQSPNDIFNNFEFYNGSIKIEG
jgi:hypothetical protein